MAMRTLIASLVLAGPLAFAADADVFFEIRTQGTIDVVEVDSEGLIGPDDTTWTMTWTIADNPVEFDRLMSFYSVAAISFQAGAIDITQDLAFFANFSTALRLEDTGTGALSGTTLPNNLPLTDDLPLYEINSFFFSASYIDLAIPVFNSGAVTFRGTVTSIELIPAPGAWLGLVPLALLAARQRRSVDTTHPDVRL